MPIHDLGSDEHGAPFYSMKQVRGTPWMQVIGQKTQTENLEILLRVADAVAFAHSRNVVHRDLKPENVMLGDFGEVLVMDWGLSVAVNPSGRVESIRQSSAMGGTPAYMAPEMATGPVQSIGVPSDVYLLGAILYEIITGQTPHTGSTVMACLFAVGKNQIQPTDKKGELLDIALRAMSTKPEDRFASVRDFQAAIREYQSHSESVVLSTRAVHDLVKAEATGDYQDYAQALFACQEALALWDGNTAARDGLSRVKYSYGKRALDNGDFDLAGSLLDADDPAHRPLLTKLAAARRERDARLQRLKVVRWTARALAAGIFVIVTVSYLLINQQYRIAKEQRAKAVEQQGIAENAQKDAVQQRNEALVQKTRAVEQQGIAETASAQARHEQKVAEDERNKARAAERSARYEAYVAQVGLASARIDENSFDLAHDLLNKSAAEEESKLRGWEWNRLNYLVGLAQQTFVAPRPIEAVAFAPDERRIATGGWEGEVAVWDPQNADRPLLTVHHGDSVHTVAWSPAGEYLLTGGDDHSAKIWNAQDGALLATLNGHKGSVTVARFSPSGRQIVTGGDDATAALWSWDGRRAEQVRTLVGHFATVWDAAFSPRDDDLLVTASEDASAILWSLRTGRPVEWNDAARQPRRGARFLGHRGPVYSVAFAPDGRTVVSGSYDKLALIWAPDQVPEFDYTRLDIPASDQMQPAILQSLRGHVGDVRTVSFSKQGNYVLTGGHDNMLKIWDARRGQLVQTLRGHAGWVRSATFSPARDEQDQLVLSGGFDSKAMLWDPRQYRETIVLNGHPVWPVAGRAEKPAKDESGHLDEVRSVAYSNDGAWIVTASLDQTAKVWSAATGQLAKTLKEGHAFLISSVAFSPDGSHALTGAGDDTVRIWNLKSGSEIGRLTGTGRQGVAAWSHDGTRILTGSRDESARLWDAATLAPAATLIGHRSRVSAVAFSRDDRRLITGDENGRAFLWSAADGAMLHELSGHSRAVSGVCFSADGRRVLTASIDKTVACWDVETGQEIAALNRAHPLPVLSVAISADGRYVATGCMDGVARLWGEDDATRPIELRGHVQQVTSVAFAPDGVHLITGSTDNTVRRWDVATGVEAAAAETDDNRPAIFCRDALPDPVWAAVYSPDGQHVLTGGGDTARLWHVSTGTDLITMRPHAGVSSAAFSADGRRVVTGSWDRTVKIWELEQGTAVLSLLSAHRNRITSVCFSPDDATILTGSKDQTARIWDSSSGAEAVAFTGHTGGVNSARFSSRGDQVVTAGDDETARIWDVATGRELRRLEGHTAAVNYAVFSSDGRLVVTGSEDNTAKVWDAATGRELHTLSGHTSAVTCVAFSSGDQRVVTASKDRTVKIWDFAAQQELLSLRGHMHLPGHSEEITSVSFSPDGTQVLTGSRDATAIIWPAAAGPSIPSTTPQLIGRR